MDSQNNDRLKRKAFGSMAWKFAERICFQLVSLVVSIVLARMLMPEDYSVISVVMIFFALCNVFVSGGMSIALIQKKNADSEDYAAALWINMAMALLLYAVLYICAPTIAGIYEKPLLIPVTRVMGLSFFFTALKSVLSAHTSRQLQFKRFFLSTIVGTVISAVIGIYMAFRGWGVWALVELEIVNTIIDTAVLFFTTRMQIARRVSLKKIRNMIWHSWKIILSTAISEFYIQLSPLIVGLKFNPSDLAYYGKGNTFPNLINSAISETMASVLLPVMSRVQDDREDVLNITRRYVKVTSYVMFPLMIGLIAVSENFVRVLLTDKWLPVAPYICIFSVSYMFDMVLVGNLQAIKAIGRSDIVLKLEILKKSCSAVIIGLFLLFSRDPVVFALFKVACTAVSVIIDTYPNRSLLGYRYRYQLADIAPNLILSVLMGLVVTQVGTVQLPVFLTLLLQIGTGVAVYIGLSILTRNKNFTYMLNFLLQMVKKDAREEQ